MKKILDKLWKLLFAIFMSLSMLPLNVTSLQAEGLDVNTAISQIIGPYIGNSTYHYSYDGGTYFDTILTSDSADELYNVGLDCTSGTLAIVSKAIRNAGGNPYDYFGDCRGKLNAVYPFELSQSFKNMSIIATGIVDSSILLPGDIIVYGQFGEKGHMNVYTGNNQTFDFGSNKNGSVGNYRGFGNYVTYRTSSASTEGSYAISRVYRITMNQSITYSVSKETLDPVITNNRMYSLAGAVFGVYTSADCSSDSQIDTLTTDANGNATGTATISSNIQTLYMKELRAPDHFSITDTSVHSSSFINGHASFIFEDAPLYTNASISLHKVDMENKSTSVNLSDAQFLFEYFDTYEIDTQEPYASWTIKTTQANDNGTISYQALLDDAHLVSGNYIKNKNGEAILPLGTLRIRETQAAFGYTLEGSYIEDEKIVSNGTSLTLQIIDENNTIVLHQGDSITSGIYTKEERPIRGSYQIQKKDKDVLKDASQASYAGVRSQADATFAHAEFDLYYLGNGSDKQVSVMIDHDGDGLGDGSEYMPSTTNPIDHITLDASGAYQTPNETYLGFGDYRLIETKAPLGYSLKDDNHETITIDFSIHNDKEKLSLEAIEKVYEGDIQITKTINTSNTSSFTQPEQGAIFDIVLKKYVLEEASGKEVTRDTVIRAYNKRTSWQGKDNSQHSIQGYTSMEYDQIVTDINGVAKSKKLAYGKYYLVQVAGSAERKIIEEVKEFSIEQENQETLFFSATNDTTGYILKLFKKDADTGNRVSLTSSAFKVHMLKDADGNDVSNKTTKDNSLQTHLVNGYVTQILGENTEKTSYDVFMTASIKQSHDLEEGIFYGVNNSIENNEVSSSTLPLTLLPGTYQLEEVITSDGFITSKPIQFKIQKDSITRINDSKQNIIEIEFSNKQLTGGLNLTKKILSWDEADISMLSKKLNQFGFTLYAREDIISPDDGSIIVKKDEIARKVTSDASDPYKIYEEVFADSKGNIQFTNLPLGKYYLKETSYPQGYVVKQKEIDIEIQQNRFDHKVDTKTSLLFGLGDVIDGAVSKENVTVLINGKENDEFVIENDVTKIYVSKKSITGDDELSGAKMQLIGEGVDLSWTSSNTPYRIEGLKPGKYVLREEAAPDGYFYHEEIEFTVNEDGKVKKVEMKDTPIHYEILKVDDNDKAVEGVQLRLFDITNVDKKVEIKLPNQGITTKEAMVLNKVLVASHQYELVEEQIVNGVYKADSIVFEVPKYSHQTSYTIAMIDMNTSISILKCDQYGTAVEGAVLQLYEAEKCEDGTLRVKEDALITTIETTSQAYDISEFVKGSREDDVYWYAIREVSTPFGFETMQDEFFTVSGNKETHQLVQLVDERKDIRIKVVKVSSKDQYKTLEGAEFTLYQQDGTIAKDLDGKECVQTSDANGIVTFHVPYQEGYTLVETKAPNGYQRNTEGYKILYEDDYDFSYENPITITFKNKPEETPNTSDSSKSLFYGSLMVTSVFLTYLLCKKRFER